MAAADIAHVASNAARKSFLTIVTDKQIHTRTRPLTVSVSRPATRVTTTSAARLRLLAVLGAVEAEPRPVVDAPVIAAAPEPAGATQPAQV